LTSEFVSDRAWSDARCGSGLIKANPRCEPEVSLPTGSHYV
jgi:hypothetical protein